MNVDHAKIYDWNIDDNEIEGNIFDPDLIPEGYLRVTEVLRPFSKFDMIDPEVLANAADRGKRVHRFCELYANNLLFEEIDQDCMNYVEAFKSWYDANVVKLLYTEKRLNSGLHKLSGSFDMLVILKGDTKPTLIDIKTPAKSSLSWPLQTAAYSMLINYEMDLLVDRRIALMLPKSGKPKAKEIEYHEHEKDLRFYMYALELYRYFNK